MLQIYALNVPGDASPDTIKRWFEMARRAALEVPGVYDLALYGKDRLTSNQYWCALDVEDESVLQALWEFSEMRAAMRLGEKFGLRLVQQSSSTRLI